MPGSGAPRSEVRAQIAFFKKTSQGTDGQSETGSLKPLARPKSLAKNEIHRGRLKKMFFGAEPPTSGLLSRALPVTPWVQVTQHGVPKNVTLRNAGCVTLLFAVPAETKKKLINGP